MEKSYDSAAALFNDLLSQAEKRSDTASAKRWQSAIDSVMRTANENVYGQYYKSNSSALLALFALTQYAGMGDINPEVAEPLFQQLAINQRNTKTGRDLENRIQIAKRTGVGARALDFSQTDTAGKLVSLSSFKGKYVLLTFWASWCKPCREENPGLVKVYDEFENRGFKILSVSLDQPNGHKNWLIAILADGLRWTHVSDLKFWNNAVARQYGVLMLPQNYLIDKDGIIIAKNLEPAGLAERLRIVFD